MTDGHRSRFLEKTWVTPSHFPTGYTHLWRPKCPRFVPDTLSAPRGSREAGDLPLCRDFFLQVPQVPPARSALRGEHRAYLTHCQKGPGVPSGRPSERMGGRGETVFYYGPGPDPRENDTVRFDTVRLETPRKYETMRSDTMRSETVRSETARSDTARLVMPPRVHGPASEVWQRANPP